ncbi:bola-like protein [Xylaria telfairii]|nr:bola-like protein [Xylaria telfairii]
MPGSQWRRIAVSALRQGSTAARSSPIDRLLPLHTQPRSLSFPAAANMSMSMSRYRSRETRTCTMRYSTASSPPSAALPEKPDYLNDAESAIWEKLVAEFAPTELLVQDISGGCGSMYGIEITSDKFRGVNMLKQQRMVNDLLRDEMKGWHGVQLRTRIP